MYTIENDKITLTVPTDVIFTHQSRPNLLIFQCNGRESTGNADLQLITKSQHLETIWQSGGSQCAILTDEYRAVVRSV